MIELGTEQYNINKKFGEYISEVCDEVILVGEEQTKPIYDGLIEKNMIRKNTYIKRCKKSFSTYAKTK